MHKTYKDVGKAIAGSWGPSSDNVNNMEGMVKRVLGDKPFTAEGMTMICLLSAIHQQLVELNDTQERILQLQKSTHSELGYLDNGSGSATRTKRGGDASDGMLAAIRRHTGPTAVKDHCGVLNARARIALHRANIKFVEDISEERLYGIHQCGAGTIKKLIDFRDKVLGRSRSNDYDTVE